MAENDTRTHADERRRLIGQLEKDRAQLLRNIETCRIRDIESPIVGEWSLKDIVGHISYWETTITVNLINLRVGRDTSSQIFTISESELQLLNEENVSKRIQKKCFETDQIVLNQFNQTGVVRNPRTI